MTKQTLILLTLAFAFIVGFEAHAEFQIDASGDIPGPTSQTSDAIAAGQVNPGLLLALQSQILNECVNQVLAKTPAETDSYLKADKIFKESNCLLSKCFQQALQMDYLAQGSNIPANNGGTKDPAIQKGMALAAETLKTQMAQMNCGQTAQQTSAAQNCPASGN